ncbi:MAG: sulfatase [Anaerolineaceae bacterium]|nr:sulfatase [Anaerolineaceae bacterium]
MSKRPNIILIVLDAARADHFSGYGYRVPTTPNIDRFAAEGVLYEQAISAAVWTVPSHASLFTGMYLSGHGLRGRNLKLRTDIHTLASFLSAEGYRTAAITANALIGKATGLSRGFSKLLDVRNVMQGDQLPRWQQLCNRLYRQLYYGGRPTESAWFDSGAWRVNFEIKRWLDARRSDTRPFFLFANYMETHLRYDPPRSFRRRFLTAAQEARWQEVNQNAWRFMSGELTVTEDDWDILTALYDAELAYVDMRLGQLYHHLAQTGLLDDTIVIITSDHGENLGDHGLMDHQYCVYDTLIRVPLVIRCPDHFPAGHREKGLVQTVDLFPTIAKLLEQHENPALGQLQGQSLLPADLGRDGRSFTITEYLAPQLHSFRRESIAVNKKFTSKLRAIRTPTYKYIWSSAGDHELYNLADDSGEQHNLITQERETAVAMAQQLDNWLAAHTHASVDEAAMDEMIVSRLEALGYI